MNTRRAAAGVPPATFEVIPTPTRVESGVQASGASP
jgi:hypothetical protein